MAAGRPTKLIREQPLANSHCYTGIPESVECLIVIINNLLPTGEVLWVLHMRLQHLQQPRVQRLLQLWLPLCYRNSAQAVKVVNGKLCNLPLTCIIDKEAVNALSNAMYRNRLGYNSSSSSCG